MSNTSGITRWDLPPLIALFGLGAIYVKLQSRLPVQIPLHFSIGGMADRLLNPERGLIEGVSVAGILWLMLLGLDRAGKNNRSLSGRRLFLLPFRCMLPTGILLFMAAILASPVLGDNGFGVGIGIAMFANLVALAVSLMHLPAKARKPDSEDLFHKAPECWHWGGLIYVNAGDSRVWVPKLGGVGWTCNFAHRQAQVLIGSLIFSPLLFVIILILFW